MPDIIQQKALTAINAIDLNGLQHSELLTLCANARHTMNHLYERLGQDSSNSSLSPSSDPLFKKKTSTRPANCESKHHNRADQRRKRTNGAGRNQVLHTDHIETIKPNCCAACKAIFPELNLKAYTAFYQLDLVKKEEEGFYTVQQTKYILHDGLCDQCQSITRASITPLKTDMVNRTISRQNLIGPTLASEMIALHKENGTSIRKVGATIERLFGIKLSAGVICAAINNSGICCEERIEVYRLEATDADLAHMDETGWKDGGENWWLWVVVTQTVCLFMMGRRTKAMAQVFLSSGFAGWLMSDGYNAYRHYKKRFRCWAHLERKAKACADSSHADISAFGNNVLEILQGCKDSIYQARQEDNKNSLRNSLSSNLIEIRALCEAHKDSTHDKTKALAREFLNDWDAIFMVIDYPHYPLTNNEAERALRHWVILRKVIQGTQSEIGRRATCALASMIATAKRRGESFVNNIKDCINTKLRIIDHTTFKTM